MGGMTSAQAVAILHTLAQGVDPATGELFPPESPYQRLETVRALLLAIQALDQHPAQPVPASSPSPATNRPLQAGQSWTPEEDEHLREGFALGTSMAALAEAHARTPGAIRSRLVRLGLIDAR